MSGIGTALAAFGTLKSAYELVRDLRKSNDPAALKAGIEELTDRLLAAREDAMRIVEEVEGLKRENAALRAELDKGSDFERNSENFILRKGGFGGFVYVEKGADQNPESPEYCAHCFDNKKLSILQTTPAHRVLLCPACKNSAKV